MNSKTPTNAKPDFNQIYTLEDLDNWSFNGTALAVLGYPIKHSVSPHMHNAALLNMAQTQFMFESWRYFKFEIHPDTLPTALERFREHKFRGLNLTIPHKVQAVDLVAKIDPGAQVMGAVNTLSLESDGGYAGYNSDGYGMASGLKRELGVDLKGRTVILYGAGGAARAAAAQCLMSGCEALWVGNRNQERLQALLDILKPIEGEQTRLFGFDSSQPPEELPKCATIINATSLGLKETDPAPVDLKRFDPEQTQVYDMIYSRKTELLQQANALGIAGADGLSMLVWQGVRSLEIWSGTSVPAQSMMTAACHAMQIEHRNA